MTDRDGDRIYELASELGLSREKDETHADFLVRFGRAVTQKYDINDKGAGEIIAAIRLGDFDDPSVRGLARAVQASRRVGDRPSATPTPEGRFGRTFEFVGPDRRHSLEEAEATVFWADFDQVNRPDFAQFLQDTPVSVLDGIARFDLSDQARALDAAAIEYGVRYKDDSLAKGIGLGVGLRNFANNSSPQLRREQLASASRALKQLGRDFESLSEKSRGQLWLVDGLLSEAVEIASTQMIDDPRRTYELVEESSKYSRPAANQIRIISQSYLTALEGRLKSTEGRVPRLSASSMSRLAQVMIFRQARRLLEGGDEAGS